MPTHKLQALAHLPNLLQSLGVADPLVRLLRDIHYDTWCTFGHKHLLRTRRGTRPGSPLADIVFHALMIKVGTAIDTWLAQQPCQSELFRQLGCTLPTILWADDIAVPALSSSAGQLVPFLQDLLRFVHTTLQELGFTLNLALGKTTAVLSFHGSDAAACRKQYQLEEGAGVWCHLSDDTMVWLHFASTYKHLGTLFASNHDLQREVASRLGVAKSAFAHLSRPLLTNRHLPLKLRLQLYHALVGTKLLFGLGSWPTLRPLLFRQLNSAHASMLRKVLRLGERSSTWSHAQIFAEAGTSDMRALLAADRLAYAQRLFAKGPCLARKEALATAGPRNNLPSALDLQREQWSAELAHCHACLVPCTLQGPTLDDKENLGNQWLEILGDVPGDADSDQRCAFVFMTWGEQWLPELIADLLDGQAEQDIEDCYAEIVELFPRFQLLGRMTHLEACLLHSATTPTPQAHRPLRSVTDPARHPKRNSGPVQPVDSLYHAQTSWHDGLRQGQFVDLPTTQSCPLYASVSEQPVFLIVHLFSGRRRHGDFHDHLQRLVQDMPFKAVVLSMDTAISSDFGDLSLTSSSWRHLLACYQAGRVAGTLCGPPCETYSEARFTPPPEPDMRWPRPVRSSARLFGLDGLTLRELKQVSVGSGFFLQCMHILALRMHYGGVFLAEHPAPPRDESRPSIWSSAIAETHGQIESAKEQPSASTQDTEATKAPETSQHPTTIPPGPEQAAASPVPLVCQSAAIFEPAKDAEMAATPEAAGTMDVSQWSGPPAIASPNPEQASTKLAESSKTQEVENAKHQRGPALQRCAWKDPPEEVQQPSELMWISEDMTWMDIYPSKSCPLRSTSCRAKLD
eukprot:s4354_g2.t1